MRKTKKRKELTEEEIVTLLKEHRDILKKYRVKRIGLFGSYVRGEQKEEATSTFWWSSKSLPSIIFWI
jgi:uncharacterized protein